jgi:tetratricopeptide (TPR) repeat protein
MNQLLFNAKELANTDPDQALRLCNDVLNEHFDDEEGQMALFMSGYIMMEAGRYGLAFNLFQRCAQLRPEQSEIWSNMGMCLEEVDPDRAILMFKKALDLKPDNAHGWANLGLMHLLIADPISGLAFSKKALEYDPGLRAAKHNMGLCQLMLRDFSNGWRSYFETLGVKHREARDYGVPDWDGTSAGTIVVYGEQGVGDEIMFASCIPDLIAAGHDVVIDCDKRLESLFKRSFLCPVYGTRFETESPLIDEHCLDYQCAIGQLPYLLKRNHEDDFPGTPYLNPNPDHMLMYRALFDSFKGEKIGLAWNGGLSNTGKKNRSFSLDEMSRLIDPKNTYISLDYKKPDENKLKEYNIKSYHGVTGKGQDIDELAAMISQLDCVITCCTTVVYIAGALGVPCYVMVPERCGYRYHTEGGFPWFKSVQLFRQSGDGWGTVCKQIINARIKDA